MTRTPEPVASDVRGALRLAANRLRMAAINETSRGGTRESYEYSEWADEAEAALASLQPNKDVSDVKLCTCHPDERPETCQHKYALTDCIAAVSTEAVELFGEGCDCFSGINGREHEIGCPVRPNKVVSEDAACNECENLKHDLERAMDRANHYMNEVERLTAMGSLSGGEEG